MKSCSRRSARCFRIGFWLLGAAFTTLIVLSGAHATEKLPAFPGAEGFGALSQGGRGGRVVFVTSLKDSGPGSLRAAIRAEGPRTVIFRVGGMIELESPLRITEPFITVAGQTSPGDGICLKNFTLWVKDTHDVVIRHLRVRPGDSSVEVQDGITIYRSRGVILDRCSASWSTDETLDISDEWQEVTGEPKTRDVTVQWCVFGESLNRSVHAKGPHGYAALISAIRDGGVSVHHNLFAHHVTRVPRPGGREGEAGLLLDFRNNVIYDWGAFAGYSAESPTASSVRMNYVGNYLKPGPSTEAKRRTIAFSAVPPTCIHAAGNILEGYAEADGDNWRMFRPEGKFARVPEPFDAPAVGTDPASRAYERVLDQAGATRPRRDSADTRIADQVRRGSGHIIDSQGDVGGWPAYRGGIAPPDADDDGMPDDWEQQHHLDPRHAADQDRDADGDGYTNLEEYLNGTDPNDRD